MISMIYKGKRVIVKECTEDKFLSLQQDAKRIMGLVADKKGHNFLVPPVLVPPENSSDTWEYAKHILDLKWPVVEVWIGYPLLVNLSELSDK